jgi:hypothetical protein
MAKFEKIEKLGSKKLAKIVVKLVEMSQDNYDKHSDCYDTILNDIDDEMTFRKCQDASDARFMESEGMYCDSDY